ncbi:MAG TPA: alpha/beta fold hydrolase [Thermoanaerobaculia bacterium]|nr:alpha/beta fold hydrolase [Thermoanaerobaculia bacterium]
MPPPRKTDLLAASLLCLLAISSLAPAAAAAAPPPPAAPPPAARSLFLHPERFALEDGTLGEAERGLLFVPINRSDPKSRVLSVELYRFPAQEGVPDGTPPIFVLQGGPGFEGLAPALEEPGFFESNLQPLTAFSEVVVVGQRGIGSSKPSTICEPARFPFLLGKSCREFWEEKGLDVSGLTVVEAAADVHDVARALGYRQITLSGSSFGSHWGMAVMRYHPQIVARALLAGIEGPDHTYDMPSGVLASLRRMAAAAEASERLRGQIPEGGLLASFEAVLDRLRTGPVSVEVEHPETGEKTEVRFTLPQVQAMIFGDTARVSSRREMPSWPADLIALARGDFSRAAKLRLERRSAEGGDEEGGPRRYRTASYFMLDCGSGISPARLEKLNADPAIPIVGNLGSFYQVSCSAWNADLGDDFRAGFDTDIPTAIVHGTWDVNTPYENALELAPRFTNGKLVTVVGGSHGALGEALRHSEPFREAIGHFLRTGDLSRLPEEVVLPEVEWEVPEG